jgi:hypothetical protein
MDRQRNLKMLKRLMNDLCEDNVCHTGVVSLPDYHMSSWTDPV